MSDFELQDIDYLDGEDEDGGVVYLDEDEDDGDEEDDNDEEEDEYTRVRHPVQDLSVQYSEYPGHRPERRGINPHLIGSRRRREERYTAYKQEVVEEEEGYYIAVQTNWKVVFYTGLVCLLIGFALGIFFFLQVLVK